MNVAREWGCLPSEVESRCTVGEFWELVAFLNLEAAAEKSHRAKAEAEAAAKSKRRR